MVFPAVKLLNFGMENMWLVYLYVFIELLTAEKSQDLIMNKGGAQLLAKMVTKTDDPQTLRMVAGALANLCGNGKHKIKNFASDDFQYSLYNLCVKIY